MSSHIQDFEVEFMVYNYEFFLHVTRLPITGNFLVVLLLPVTHALKRTCRRIYLG